MSKKIKHKNQKSKIYNPNMLSLPYNNDMDHEKLWNIKVEQAKSVQEQKQIDRILYGIVKEKLFGQLLGQDTRISNEGYYALDRISKEIFNNSPSSRRPKRKIYPLSNQPSYELQPKSRIKHKTIDVLNRTTKTGNKAQFEQSYQIASGKSISKNILQNVAGSGSNKKFFNIPKQISTSKMPNLQNYFREVTNNLTTMLFDIKLTKEMLFKINKQKQITSQRCLQKFLYYFAFPNGCNFKQYTNWLENAFNCSFVEANFFTFQVLDESKNGYLAISDLFRALHDFPMEHSSLLQKQIYQLMQKLKSKSQKIDNEKFKPTVEQIIITNHTLKLEQMRQLVKESNKDIVSGNCKKFTTYHKSMYALEHNPATRQKNMQLEYSSENNISKGDSFKVEGLRFLQYSNMFFSRRSQIFLLVGSVLMGEYSKLLE